MASPDVVIPAAGIGRRMKSYGPKCLLKAGDETILSRQVRLLRLTFPDSHFIVVTGHGSERVRRNLPDGVTLALNPDFESTNVTRSIAIGMARGNADTTLVVYGDLVFGEGLPEAIDTSASSVLYEENRDRSSEVGVNVVGDSVTNFAFGLPLAWSQVVYLSGLERRLFLKSATESCRSRYFGHEILNRVLDQGGQFLGSPAGGCVWEVDSAKDIPYASVFARKSV